MGYFMNNVKKLSSEMTEIEKLHNMIVILQKYGYKFPYLHLTDIKDNNKTIKTLTILSDKIMIMSNERFSISYDSRIRKFNFETTYSNITLDQDFEDEYFILKSIVKFFNY